MIGWSKGAVRVAHLVVDVVPGLSTASVGDAEVHFVAGTLGSVHGHGSDRTVEVGRRLDGGICSAIDEDAGGAVTNGIGGDVATGELDFVADRCLGAVLDGDGG